MFVCNLFSDSNSLRVLVSSNGFFKLCRCSSSPHCSADVHAEQAIHSGEACAKAIHPGLAEHAKRASYLTWYSCCILSVWVCAAMQIKDFSTFKMLFQAKMIHFMFLDQNLRFGLQFCNSELVFLITSIPMIHWLNQCRLIIIIRKVHQFQWEHRLFFFIFVNIDLLDEIGN